MSEHWYYLHTNGQIIHKRTWPGDDSSTFVRRIWPVDPSRREHAWRIVLEALALGADIGRVRELCGKWGITPGDMPHYLNHDQGSVTPERAAGLRVLIESVWGEDYDEMMTAESLARLAGGGE